MAAMQQGNKMKDLFHIASKVKEKIIFCFNEMIVSSVKPIKQIYKINLSKKLRHFGINFLVFTLFFNASAPSFAALEALENGEKGYPQNGVIYLHQDVVGNTVLATDSDGVQVAKVVYTPYGDIDARSTGKDVFREKYAGQELDTESGLYYFGARYYDPELGIFTTPEDDAEFFNPYLYAGNDPASATDTGGHFYVAIARMVARVLKVAIKVALRVAQTASPYRSMASANGSWNPNNWDWSLGSGSYGAVLVGAVFGSALGAAGSKASRYEPNGPGKVGENAGFTGMGGGSRKQVASPSMGSQPVGGPIGSAGDAFGSGKVGVSGGGGKNTGGPEARNVKPGKSGCNTCPCTSFPAGTLVSLKGNKLIPIEKVKVQDVVWTYNQQNNKAELATVSATMSRMAPGLMEITVDKEILKATSEHPFWVEGKGWIQAEDLKVGYELKTQSNAKVKISKVTYNQKSTTVYNFTVAQLHNYYVGNTKVLVHNTGCGDFVTPEAENAGAFGTTGALVQVDGGKTFLSSSNPGKPRPVFRKAADAAIGADNYEVLWNNIPRGTKKQKNLGKDHHAERVSYNRILSDHRSGKHVIKKGRRITVTSTIPMCPSCREATIALEKATGAIVEVYDGPYKKVARSPAGKRKKKR